MAAFIVTICLAVVVLFGFGAIVLSMRLQKTHVKTDSDHFLSTHYGDIPEPITPVESISTPTSLDHPASLYLENQHLVPNNTTAFAAENTTEFFLTARNSQSTFRIGWGLYAATIGASVIFAPSSVVADSQWGGGYLCLISYSLFSGLPLVVAAYVGHRIRQVCPAATSIGSFARWRYGRTFELFIAFQVLFNVALALAAEFTAVGDLFGIILGTNRVWPVIVIGTVTMIYTTVGGLYVSILTDQYQSIFSLLLLVIVTLYLGIFFRIDQPLPPLPPYLDANPMGYASFFTLGVSLLSSTLMSDAVWQRVWAAKDERALKQGSWMACGLSMLVVGYFGAAGLLATWMGISKDPSTAFFSLIQYVSSGKRDSSFISESDVGMGITTGISTWILTLVCVVVVTMNESAVDSFQSALADTILSLGIASGHDMPIKYARLAVLVINIPIMIIGSQGYPIASLYLITNIFTSCSFIPLIMGLIPSLDYLITGPAALCGSIFGILSVAGHGWYTMGNLPQGIRHHFFDARYDWPSFVFGIIGSVMGMFLYSGLEICWYRWVLRKPVPFPRHLNEQVQDRHTILSDEAIMNYSRRQRSLIHTTSTSNSSQSSLATDYPESTSTSPA